MLEARLEVLFSFPFSYSVFVLIMYNVHRYCIVYSIDHPTTNIKDVKFDQIGKL